MMKKFAFFVFNGELICFVHVLLNALDLNSKGFDVKIIIEGAATKLVPDLVSGSNSFPKLFQDARNANLISAVCKACSKQMGVLDSVLAGNLPIGDDLSGHPGMSTYINQGYEIITF
jgi:hypothetical protein